MYEIHSKNDFQTGATLVVRIHAEDVDKKALYTLLAHRPDFVLPFRHRAIDDQVEFIYQIGNRSKLVYLSGNRSPKEYVDLWSEILQPLLDCGDWFLTPYSFFLKQEHLYYDKVNKVVGFVYIPSLRPSSDYNDLKGMVMEVAKQNHSTDINLENKVVWAIQDFNPKSFLQMVKLYGTQSKPEGISHNEPEQAYKPLPPTQPSAPELAHIASTPSTPATSSYEHKKQDDFSINISTDKKAQKAEKPKSGLFGSGKPKSAPSPKPETKEKGSLWGSKKVKQQEIIHGAAATPNHQSFVQEPVPHQHYLNPIDMDEDVTQLDFSEATCVRLRYIGNSDHAKAIDVNIDIGGVFTIGRFDASIGSQQSSFEFDKKTKAVSRRHAAIERSEGGYSIVDLSSAAGSFVNGQKLPPNVPYKLENGCRVSFGHSGADYSWEE